MKEFLNIFVINVIYILVNFILMNIIYIMRKILVYLFKNIKKNKLNEYTQINMMD